MDEAGRVKRASFIMTDEHGNRKAKPSDLKPKRSKSEINVSLQNAEAKKEPPQKVVKQSKTKATEDVTENKTRVIHIVSSKNDVPQTYQSESKAAASSQTNEAKAQVESKKTGNTVDPKASRSKPAQRAVESKTSTDRNLNKLPAKNNFGGRPFHRKQTRTSFRSSFLFSEIGTKEVSETNLPKVSSSGAMRKPCFVGVPNRNAKEVSKKIYRLCGGEVSGKLKSINEMQPLGECSPRTNTSKAKVNLLKPKDVMLLKNTDYVAPLDDAPSTSKACMLKSNLPTPAKSGLLQRKVSISETKPNLPKTNIGAPAQTAAPVQNTGPQSKIMRKERPGAKAYFRKPQIPATLPPKVISTPQSTPRPQISTVTKHNMAPPTKSNLNKSETLTTIKSVQSRKCEASALNTVTSSACDPGTFVISSKQVNMKSRQNVWDTGYRKLQEAQREFLQKVENLKAPDELRFVVIVQNDECKFIIKHDHLKEMPKKLPAESVQDFKEKLREAVESCLKDTLNGLDHSLNAEKIEQQRTKTMNKLFDYVDTLVRAEVDSNVRETEIVLHIAEIQKIVQDDEKDLQQLEERFADLACSKRENEVMLVNQMNMKLQALQMHKEELENALLQKMEETNYQIEQNAELTEKLKSYEENIFTLNEKLSDAQNQVAHYIKENLEQSEELQKTKTKLEDVKKQLEQADTTITAATQHESELQEENRQLKGRIEKLEVEVGKLQQENNCVENLRAKLLEVEDQNRILQERQNLLINQSGSPEQYEATISTLKKVVEEKELKIEKLKSELSSAHLNIEELEKTVLRQRKLLEVRGDVIDSLQINDNIRLRVIEDTCSEESKKIQKINELQNDLGTKREECDVLSKQLGSMQSELSRQQRLITVLEVEKAKLLELLRS